MIIGVDVGGTKTAVVLGTAQAKIVWRKQFPTHAHRGYKKIYQELIAMIAEALKNSPEPVKAISVSIGGPLDVLKGIIKSPPNLPGWDDVPLKQMLSEQFSLPVYIEHDGNAGALAEHYFGAGRGYQNIIFLTMGTGLGAGLILDGRLYRGTTDTAGEIGHIRMNTVGPFSYGKFGSLEAFGSGTGIAKLAHGMYPKLWDSSASILDVYTAYQSGREEARKVFEQAAFYIGRGFAILVDILNPQRIILGGIGMRIGDAILPIARQVMFEETLSEAANSCEIIPSQLGEMIGDIASLCAALDQGNFLERKP
ncbi:MAG: ROK family protein [bacterium]